MKTVISCGSCFGPLSPATAPPQPGHPSPKRQPLSALEQQHARTRKYLAYCGPGSGDGAEFLKGLAGRFQPKTRGSLHLVRRCQDGTAWSQFPCVDQCLPLGAGGRNFPAGPLAPCVSSTSSTCTGSAAFHDRAVCSSRTVTRTSASRRETVAISAPTRPRRRPKGTQPAI